MLLIRGDSVSKSYGDKLIIKESSFQINDKEKIGLIGANGVGKTTLLKIISGEIEPENKEKIVRKKNLNVGYLAQEINLNLKSTLYDEGMKAFNEILSIREKMDSLAKIMEERKNNLNKVIKEYGELQEEFENKGGYTYEARLKAVLYGLGFKKSDWRRLVEHLSGGEKCQLAYAKLFLREPELLLLDEPTNHLDIEATEWLEKYLMDYERAMVIVSHDRYFLDRVVQKIWELKEKELKHYSGNYTHYLREKEERIKQQEKRYKFREREISRQEEFIRKNIVGQTTKQAQSRRKMLHKMERVERPQREKKIGISFSPKLRGGNKVLEVSHLAKSFGGEFLFKDLSIQVERGERIGIIGPNGTGKTTLLKIIMGKEKPDEGEVKIGKEIKIGYYDQHLAELNSENSVLEEVWSINPGMKIEELRSFLGRFLFTQEEVFAPLKDLSEGEKARVLLAKLMLAGVNFLILDEPTNHLDISSRRTLEKALVDYEGTILVVSHDRYLLDKIVEKTLYFDKDRNFEIYSGNYSYFLEKKEEKKLLKEEEKPKKVKIKKIEKKVPREVSISPSFEEIESEIIFLEEEREKITRELEKDETYQNTKKLNDLIGKYQELSQKLDIIYDRWEKSISTLKGFTKTQM